MTEAKHYSSYTPPSTMEELKALPLRDYTYYRLSWFLPDTISTVDAFQRLVNLCIKPFYKSTLQESAKNDLLLKYFAVLNMFPSIPEEYYIYPDTIGVVENVLINAKNGYDVNLAVDIYVKNVQNTHRVYRFVISPRQEGALPGRVAVEIYECTSNNVTLPANGTRDVHLLFRNASTYNDVDNPDVAVPVITADSTATAIVVYYNEDDIPVVARTFWKDKETLFTATEELPKDKFVALHECTRHNR